MGKNGVGVDVDVGVDVGVDGGVPNSFETLLLRQFSSDFNKRYLK